MRFETFLPLTPFLRAQLEEPVPVCYNGHVFVVRYCVEYRQIPDPPEVIAKRLQDLLKTCRTAAEREVIRKAMLS